MRMGAPRMKLNTFRCLVRNPAESADVHAILSANLRNLRLRNLRLTDVLSLMEAVTPAPVDPASLLSAATDADEKFDAFVVFTARGVYRGDEPTT